MENFFAGPCPVTSDDGTPAVRPTRRGVVAGALSGLGALALTGCEAQSRGSSSASNSSSAATSAQRATWTVASGPPRQSGVTTKPGTHAHWVGLDLPDDATKDELRRALDETRAGTPLSQSLTGVARRTNVMAVTRFIEGVIVALERGTPLADVLRAQAQDAREAARGELIESAGRKEVLMMAPVVFLVLPITILFAVYPGIAALDLNL